MFLEGATLTEPLQDTVHVVSYGETIIIRCSAIGEPQPTVTFSYDDSGERVTIEESTSGAPLEFEFIAFSLQKFYCTAKNQILNENGVTKEVERSVSITVNLASGSD